MLDKKKYIPNIVTLTRIVCTLIIVILFYFDSKLHSIFSASLFLLASATDFFDGYFARKFNAQSKFGAVFDHISDKILIVVVLIMLIKYRNVNELPCLIMIVREIIVSGLKEFLILKNMKLVGFKLTKIKTAMQMGCIFVLLLNPSFLCKMGDVFLWLTALFTILSSHFYLKGFMKLIREDVS